ncbi:MAG: rod shape-determining protein MreC [Ruminococcaceae bacterium]|nr:rod shape-determining protein MreC [Oscillospiraceae bacterium]
MREFFHTIKFKILVCIFALLLGFLIYVAIAAGASSLPKAFLETVSSPFVSLSTTVSDWMESTIDKFVNADKYKQENELLKEQLAKIYSNVLEKEELQKENDQLKDMLEISENNKDFKWSPPCSVTARNSADISGGFTINRGTNDGISLYDPVFTKTGLVGIVSEISGNYAIVSTVLSDDINIGVRGADSHALGIIENDLDSAYTGHCVMNYTGRNSGIEKDEVIVTSGSAFFPKDVLLGTVTDIINDSNGLSVHVQIKPFVDVFTVSDVFVLIDFEGKGEDVSGNSN